MMKDAIVRSPRRLKADDGAAEVDAETVLDNVVELDKLLDDKSRRELDALPVLELSKHMRVRATVDADMDDHEGRRRGPAATEPTTES
jgi:hypothetical protein